MDEYHSAVRKPKYADPKERQMSYTREGRGGYHSFVVEGPEYLGRRMRKYKI